MKEIKIQGAIFDMDGTLVNSMILWDVIWEDIGRRYMNVEGFVPDADFDKTLRTMTLRGAMATIHEHYGVGESAEALFAEADALCRDFYANRVELKSGAREFLDRLYEAGIPMCLATATAPDLIPLSIARCDMAKYFGAVLSCVEIGKGKEHPDIFLEAQKRLGTPVEETWVFEDSYVAAHTAHKIGMKTVGVYDKNNYDHERMEQLADIYIGQGHTLAEITLK